MVSTERGRTQQHADLLHPTLTSGTSPIVSTRILLSSVFLKHWPVIASVCVLLITSGVLTIVSMHRNQGHLIYALDDAYIHMAIAKNLVEHSVWGITRYEFSSASSSIGWTLLLALDYALFGVNEFAPLLLNLLSAIFVLVAAYLILRRHSVRPANTFLVLLAVIFLTPLPPLMLTGMEHCLQTGLTLLAAFLSAQLICGTASGGPRREYYALLVLAPLLTGIRFEGMFLAFVITLFLLRQEGWIRALGFGTSALLPVFVFSIISYRHGWPLLPTSVLLKSTSHLTSPSRFAVSLVTSAVTNSRWAPHLPALLVGIGLLGYLGRCGRQEGEAGTRVMAAIFAATTVLHLAFAAVGWFYRYEAYLVALGTLVAACQMAEIIPQHGRSLRSADNGRLMLYTAFLFLLWLLAVPLLSRGKSALKQVVQATTNIFEQQYQMALFFRDYYPRSAIAINDIGAVNFFADIRCLDLRGLGSRAVAEAALHNAYTTDEIRRLTIKYRVEVAILYDSWFAPIGGLPQHWAKVAQWTIPNNVIAGSDTVSIYAVNVEHAGILIQRLREFAPRLPRDIRQWAPQCGSPETAPCVASF
jgi:hypothetical protein